MAVQSCIEWIPIKKKKDDTDTVKFEKVKVQNSVGLKYKFYKAILKASSFWRGFSQSRKLDSRYTSEQENSRGTLSHHHYLVMWLWQILISQILIHSYVQMSRYFWKSRDPIVMTLLAPGDECHLDLSPKSCTYPTLAIIDHPEVKIISILLYENSNCQMLFCTFTIGNSLFLTTVQKTMFCVSLFSVKEFLIYKFKLLSFLKKFTISQAQLTFMIFYLSYCDADLTY